ncbi:imidazole glycerol phosphate synthase subunit HisH [Desulforamulus hydrothermalis]|uniref:Imidazole glycerol phosphate synthase subunit HisH n=1 Tax=Desulforamulus hydrothermalis Lam5 = DSM 18033 TaxID=1121428 RepID=K8E0S8_9FIRM|nr:imidazole glycerol phosphate synthase subunit HisH [Desulforamulus hydrothermalis]CCO09239.1 Imidazole glycerol phosphate synthase subunit HisH [Desulforamulus hydrothermalis Lam5 = DSM 18033]SHH05837.1 imidazole glycerol phosphate synthase subunit hisH [Desulforamulus hydrothermalis Lam5 = DSM 18033]
MIAVIDYGMGNLRSVQKAFQRVGCQAEIVRDPAAVAAARAVVLPGVGAFRDAMANLQSAGMVEAIHRVVAAGRPFLGICLGLQLLFESSEEFGHHRGLGIFPGTVKRFPEGELKVPHMGWNQVSVTNASPLMEGIPDRSAFYFVHSYYVEPADPRLVIASADYGLTFAAVVGRQNVYGIQFHPEKSSTLGLRILENFGKTVRA